MRLPRNKQRIRPVKPELMCTTSPPAKSSAPMMPPIRLLSPPHTMWANGAYATRDHRATNAATAPKRMRPATDPVMMAQVIRANAIWNVTSMMVGYVVPSGTAAASSSMVCTMPASPSWSNPPMKGLAPSPPYASDQPASTHVSPTMPITQTT